MAATKCSSQRQVRGRSRWILALSCFGFSAMACACGSQDGDGELLTGAAGKASIPLLRSRDAVAMASDDQDGMILVEGLTNEGTSTVWSIPSPDAVEKQPLLDVPLALPVAYWDGINYIVGGLRCPGWAGQPGSDTEFISSYCRTTTYSFFRLSSDGRVEPLVEVDAGPVGSMALATVGRGTALLRSGYSNDFVRIESSPGRERAATVKLEAPGLAGVCATPEGFEAYSLPAISPRFPEKPTQATALARYSLPQTAQAWQPLPHSSEELLGALRDVIFAGCDGNTALLVAHQSSTEVAYLELPVGEPDKPGALITLEGLEPFSNMGMVGGQLITLTRVQEPVSYRVGVVENGVARTVASIPGASEAPDILALSERRFAYLAATGRGSLSLQFGEVE